MSTATDDSKNMKVVINGDQVTVQQSIVLDSVIEDYAQALQVDLAHCVVAVNQSLVHRQDYASFQLKDEDEIDILTAVVGG